MTGPDDVPGEMTRHEMDDAAAERLLRGAPAPGQPEGLQLLLSEMRALAADPPAPSAELAALLRDGFVPAAAPAAVVAQPSWRRRLGAVAGLSLAGKVLLGTGVAVASVAGAAGTGLLPDAVEDGVSSVIRTLTPSDEPGARPELPAPPTQRPVSPSPVPALPSLPPQAPLDAPARGPVPQPVPEQRPVVPPTPGEQRDTRAPDRPVAPPAPPVAEERRATPAAPGERGGARPEQRPGNGSTRGASPSPAATPGARPDNAPDRAPDDGAASTGTDSGAAGGRATAGGSPAAPPRP